MTDLRNLTILGLMGRGVLPGSPAGVGRDVRGATLQELIAAWPELPEPVRAAVLVLVRAVGP